MHKRMKKAHKLQKSWGAVLLVVGLAAIVGFTGCKEKNTPKSKDVTKKTKAASRPASQPAKRRAAAPWTLARPKAAWADTRVAEAKKRLQASPAGKLLWQAIEAAGGLKKWFTNGPLAFRFTYKPLKKKGVRDTKQVIDTWSSRAKHTHVAAPNMHFGWDGKQAWVLPKGKKQPIKAPRFWSLTPYYFVGVPFVLADPGVILKKLKSQKLKGRTYDLVHASFAPGTGDAPKDYYVVYIDAKTKRIGGLRYVVSYPGFFPKGGHSPEKLVIYEGKQVASGISFAKTIHAYKWNPKKQKHGKMVTKVWVRDVAFRKDLPTSFFHTPANAGTDPKMR